jgi:hypothetical protein
MVPKYFATEIFYTFFTSGMCATRPTHLIFLGLITNISILMLDDKEFLAVNINVVGD